MAKRRRVGFDEAVGAVLVRPTGGDERCRSGTGSSKGGPDAGRARRRGPSARSRGGRWPSRHGPPGRTLRPPRPATAPVRRPGSIPPNGSSGSGASRVHSTTESGSGSPDAMPRVNGSFAGVGAARAVAADRSTMLNASAAALIPVAAMSCRRSQSRRCPSSQLRRARTIERPPWCVGTARPPQQSSKIGAKHAFGVKCG